MSERKRKFYPMFNVEGDENSSSSSKRQKSGQLKIWSWNVAGLRGCIKKGGAKLIENSDADIVMLQETKCPDFPPEIERIKSLKFKKLLPSKDKPGHSGVAFLSRERPLKWTTEFFGDKRFDRAGRLIHAEYEEFHVICVYSPNSGRGLVNLDLRKDWEDQVLEKLVALDKEKPVIYAGDMNVAHNEIDLRNPEPNRNKTAGFTDQERNDFTRLLESGFVDVYRSLNPKKVAYTYFSYMRNARKNNVGWRLDYFVLSERILDWVISCEIDESIEKESDHLPISLTIKT